MTTPFPTFEDVPDPNNPDPAAELVDAAYLNSVNVAVNTLENTMPGKVDAGDIATVATSGAYTDLIGRPFIPDSADDIGAQPVDADLTAIAGLTPTNNDVLQRKVGAWTNRTPAQLKTDLALAATDVGLGNVTNAAQVQLGTVDVKGDLIVATAADTVARLPAGSNGQVLKANSTTTTGLEWAASSGGSIDFTIVDAKGDLIAGTAADAAARLGVGSNGQVLNADSAATTGLSWVAANAHTHALSDVTNLFLAVDTTGTTDAAPTIAAAATALGSGGGVLRLPPGSVRLDSRVSIAAPNIVLAGAGQGQTTIVAGSAIGSNEIILLTSAATGSAIRDLTITATASANYAALRVAAANARVERVTVTGGTSGALRGIAADSTATNLEINHCSVSGIRTAANTYGTGVGISVAGDDTLIDHCVVTNCTGTGSTAYYAQMGGIFTLGVTGTSGRRIRVLNCRSYSNGVHGLYATGCDNLVIDGGSYYLNGALATAHGGAGGADFGRGITVGTAAAERVKIVNTYLFNNEENGLIVSGGASGTGSSDSSLIRDTIISGNHAYNNNLGGYAGGHGIEVNSFGGVISSNISYNNHNGIAVTGVRQIITGNRCYNNTSTDTTQGNGIQIYFQGVTPPTVTGVTTTNGSNQVTVTSGGFPDVFEDQTISGTGVPGGTVVIAISGNTLTMSAAATASGTVTLTFTAVNSRNQVIGNFCAHNDNNGIRAFGTVNHQGVIISNNSLLFNGLAERSGVLYDLLVSNQCRFGAYLGNSSFSSSSRISISDPYPNRVGNTTASDNGMTRSLTYSTSVTWAGENAEMATLVVTDGVAFTMGSPQTSYSGRKATYKIVNSSGGAMGTITWGTGQFQLAGAFTNPANGNARTITFQYDGSKWVELSRTAADMT